MPIEVNGTPVNDGDPLEVNGVQAQEVKVNGETVWVNTIPPSAIVDFTGSSNRVGQIQIHFTPASGLPAPRHDLYNGGTLVASGVTNGQIIGFTAGDYTLHVKAINVAGTVDSNSAACRSQVAAGNRTYTASNSNIVLPTGVKTIAICMCGGGGSGHQGRAGGGGGSGAVSASRSYNGSALNFVQGQGGQPYVDISQRGGNGTASTLTGGGIGAQITAAGGQSANFNAGGIGANGGGNGAQGDPWVEAGSSSGCGGSYAGGSKTNNNHGGGGGAGGYGAGGSNNAVTPANGGGGGSGGHLNFSFPARAGANGQLRISWNQH